MNDYLNRWFSAKAEWWEFWKPKSGYRGGLILGGVLLTFMDWLGWLP